MAREMGWIGKNPNEVSYNKLENPKKRCSETFLSNAAIYAYGNSNGDKKTYIIENTYLGQKKEWKHYKASKS